MKFIDSYIELVFMTIHLLFNNFVIFKIVVIDFITDVKSIVFIKNLIGYYFFHYEGKSINTHV